MVGEADRRLLSRHGVPFRWVTANKGAALHPNVRCRLVAKHLASKYGEKDMEDLFAAMPPFELVKALLVKAAQRRDRKRTVRKVMFADASKAHLYTLRLVWRIRHTLLFRLSAASREHVGFLASGFTACAQRPMDGRRNIRSSWKR